MIPPATHATAPTRIPFREAARYLGPAFLVSVGYIDPGNWATNIAAGSSFNYDLLWVVLVSNIMAIVLQTVAAKLGLVSGKNLAELCREQFSRPVALSLWVTIEIAMMATDVAEFLGAALGFHILFGMPMSWASAATAVAVVLILGLDRFGFRRVEFTIIGLVAVVGLCYVAELLLAHPDTALIAQHLIIPELNGRSILVAVGILGATVMPHNLFLHSDVIKTRLSLLKTGNWSMRSLIRFSFIDSVIALNASFLINAAMIIMAAAVFFHRGLPVESIEEAHRTLAPLLGQLSSVVFAIALLAAGLSSSVTATMAGQVVMGGFLNVKIDPWIRRIVTMIPAIIVIAMGLNTLQVLIVSQVMLSIALPFACIPLLIFTSRPRIMGEFVNSRVMIATVCLVTATIIYLNALLLVSLF